MSRLQMIKAENGYTFIESLFQLIVFVTFAHLFVLFFLWKAPIEQQYTNMSDGAWELFALDLQASIVDVKEFNVHLGGRGIRFITDRGQIDIGQSNSMIRKTIDGQGHVPFLTNVYSVYFTVNDPVVSVTVTMHDGTRKERDFAIGFNSK
ncbi:ComGF family competence protein [Sporosarcina sp. Marseille-Q4063]|uniref:competence type IV pilus minor pilin ComGF n=1 Tax=Sporosarcina sp. Marseille-Q4063 TaxID=2810514 RepID=UPI001BAF09AC|nr:competence type IV pilus minor pilin ComGF [Sporosarcina sp. Marseille-Q4063]QUW22260.1 ComGF family competence protein [Sporosarcina sp. Marseille-Q4063]